MTNGNYDSLIADMYDEEPVVELERKFFHRKRICGHNCRIMRIGSRTQYENWLLVWSCPDCKVAKGFRP